MHLDMMEDAAALADLDLITAIGPHSHGADSVAATIQKAFADVLAACGGTLPNETRAIQHLINTAGADGDGAVVALSTVLHRLEVS